MRYLSGEEEKNGFEYLEVTATTARDSICNRSKCGSVIVKDNAIIGRGYNSPPLDKESQRRCSCSKDSYHKKVTDKTCCMHAEERAIIDALKKNAEEIRGARLYFLRLDKKDMPVKSGKPYCTICSKMALDVGIEEFVLWHEEGIAVYTTDEYNTLSFQYTE